MGRAPRGSGADAVRRRIAGTPPRLLHQMYQRCGKPALTPSKTTIWQVVTHTDAAALDTAVGSWLAARAGIDITIDTPVELDPRPETPHQQGDDTENSEQRP